MSTPAERFRRLERQLLSPGPVSAAPLGLEVPNIIDFVTSPTYLDHPQLFPRQATILKIICLEIELLTDYDRGVIAEWEAGFSLQTSDGQLAYAGSQGLPPGTVERMLTCRAQGRRWFSEVVLVLGRRAGKGYLGALLGAYVVWNMLAKENPQAHFGLERTKQLTAMVFAAERAQATQNQFKDLAKIIAAGPCFAPFLASHGADSIRLRTPADLSTPTGGRGGAGEGSLVIDARASTGVSGRGPAAFALFFDEMAHMASPGLQRSADEIFTAATPALAQFPMDSIVVMASSPGSQTGEFYAAYQRALAVRGGAPANPTMMVLQLPSWGTYLDWGLTGGDGLVMYPGGPKFQPLAGAVIADTPSLRAQQRANPETFAVEYLADWRTSQDAYLDKELVHQIFDAYNGELLQMGTARRAEHRYFMHCDPSTSGANFAVAVGHGEVGTDGKTHVIFDHLAVFRPRDFTDGRIDYLHVQDRLRELIVAFVPERVTFDQFNSAMLIQALRDWLPQARLWRNPQISERTATHGQNWDDAEVFKTAIGLGLVHAPLHQLARDELLYLQRHDQRVDHPTSGPVRTSDLADCMFTITAQILGATSGYERHLGSLPLRGARLGGFFTPNASDNAVFDQFRSTYRLGRTDPNRSNPARSGGRRR